MIKRNLPTVKINKLEGLLHELQKIKKERVLLTHQAKT